MHRGKFKGQVRSETAAVEHKDGRRDVTCGGEVVKRRAGIFKPKALAGMDKLALAVAAVIEDEDVDASFVQLREMINGITEIAILPMQKKNCVAAEWRIGRRRNPPSTELRQPGARGGKADRFKGQPSRSRCARDCGYGVIEELPAPLPEEQAEHSPSAKHRGRECCANRGEQPPA